MLTGLTTADFNGATVEKFMRTVSATADYDFGNGMSYSGTNRNRINHSSRYGLGTDEMGNVVYVNGGRDGEGDGFFATGAPPATFSWLFAGGTSHFGFYGAAAWNPEGPANGMLTLAFYGADDVLIDGYGSTRPCAPRGRPSMALLRTAD